ncbi:hypothetical protein FCN13_19955 [Pseudomonas sp. UMC631]|nr:hypothetical protein [Pseudomonas sp. UMA643]NTY19296.1 hypothetical protein [Pseudomonas sp. UMC3103]NTY24212.1 hypothetical protein [Pseudomonas sp. UMA603]NTY31094.1 hypothetical protein [Pseudomonas sp. UMC3129]NTY55853.1 hypothetical protein [Pseudomonas sp. UMC631]NTY66205.1 hypothetical protein [Pseudomonas sp. UMC3106]NUA34121.1 hypothetical protein [Pseudomonas sp. UMA601]
MSFWLRYETLQEREGQLRYQLEVERCDRAGLVAEMMELQSALRAERFHVEQLQRKVKLLQLPREGEVWRARQSGAAIRHHGWGR